MLLIGIFSLTIIIALAQIILRNIFDFSISWADDLVKIAVLWIGLLGAMVASCKMEHIRIDVLNQYLSEQWQTHIQHLTYLFSAAVCLVVSWYALEMVQLDKADNVIAFAKVPLWVCESIIPYAFLMMGLRFLAFNFGIKSHQDPV